MAAKHQQTKAALPTSVKIFVKAAERTTYSCRQSSDDGGNGAILTIDAADPVEKVIAISSGRRAAAVMPGDGARLRRRHVLAQASTAWVYRFMPTLRAARAGEICRTLGVAVVIIWAHTSATRTTFSTPAQERACEVIPSWSECRSSRDGSTVRRGRVPAQGRWRIRAGQG